jgi:hypothetical protein
MPGSRLQEIAGTVWLKLSLPLSGIPVVPGSLSSGDDRRSEPVPRVALVAAAWLSAGARSRNGLHVDAVPLIVGRSPDSDDDRGSLLTPV